MNYNETIEYLDYLHVTGKKVGTKNIAYLMDKLGSPQDRLKFIHVAGTNGKGSTCTMISSVLKTAGYKTGLFISPYIIDFCERVQINGEMIPKEKVAEIVSEIKVIADEMAEKGVFLTHFEAIVALGFIYFSQENCDLVVLETGIGGREDATNIISSPLVSVLTKISIDHVDMLGDTVAKIATEKCGIIKKGSPIVCYPEQSDDATPIIMQKAAEMSSEVIIPSPNRLEILEYGLFGSRVLYNDIKLSIPFMGKYQVQNCNTALSALEVLSAKGFGMAPHHISEGISNARIPARTELLDQNPAVVLDGAHNADGILELVSSLKEIKNGRLHVIMGIMSDKEYRETVGSIAEIASTFTAVTPEYYRGLKAEILASEAKKYNENVSLCEDVYEAYKDLVLKISSDDTILICGSLYLAAEFREKFYKNN